MAKELRVGLIGYGFMGRAHSNAYRRLNKFFPVEHRPVLKAVCARNEPKAADLRRRLGLRARRDRLAQADRSQRHRRDRHLRAQQHAPGDRCVAAAKAGKMILCEKPLAMNVAEAQEMVDGRREGRRAQHGLVQLPPRAGHLPGQAGRRREAHRPAVPLPRHLPAGLDDLRRRAAGRRRRCGGWTRKRGRLRRHRRSAGPLDRHGRCGSTARSRAWSPTTETFVKERKHAETGKVEPVGIDDACMFLAVFANGSMGTFESTRYARGRKNFNTFELNGDDGSVYFDLEEPAVPAVLRVQAAPDRARRPKSHLTGWRKIHVTNSEHPVHEALVGARLH